MGLVFGLNAMFPQATPQMKKLVYTSLVAPVEPTITEPQPVSPRLELDIKPVQVVDTPATAELVVPAPVRRPRGPEIEIKAPEIRIANVKLPDLPKMPNAPLAQVVATNTFAQPTNVMPSTAKPAAQVQTGGFGDPNGVPANGKGVANIAAKGLVDLPTGAGFGNGFGGEKGTAGIGIVGNGVVQPSGFDRAVAQKLEKLGVGGAAAIPVEIVSKPKPTYTEEGRKLKIEGEVRLEVRFTADGQVQVVKLLQGLGYGLDEQALRCAEQIKFRPAMHDGHAVDSTAVIHIVFELAS
jgi:TonB family protein